MLADEVTEGPLGEDVAGHLGVGIGQRRNAWLRRGGSARSRGPCQLHPVAGSAALAGSTPCSTARLVAGPPHRASAASGYRASATAAVATAEYIHRQSERRMIHPSIRFTARASRPLRRSSAASTFPRVKPRRYLTWCYPTLDDSFFRPELKTGSSSLSAEKI